MRADQVMGVENRGRVRGAALLLALAVLAVGPPAAWALEDNKGTEFVLGFQANVNGPTPFLFITGDSATNGVVSIPGLAVPFNQAFAVVPGAITTVQLPLTAFVTNNDVVTQQGILVTAEAEVVVYGLNQAPFTTDAYLGLPTDILGTEHRVITYASTSQFLVVGTVDGTTVTITPSAAASSHPAGVPYNVALNRLDTYQLNAPDLTSSLITSDQPVAVFSGNPCVNVPFGVSFCDHLVEQIPSTSTWGVSFLTVPLATRTAGDVFRIIARDDATDVAVDGTPLATLNAGQFVETDLASGTYHQITATGPALVMQYSKGSGADGVPSDPFMMMIPPTEQFLKGYTVTTPAEQPVAFTNYVNAVVNTLDVGNCTIDGGAFSAPFVAIGTTGFSAVQEPVSIGTHTLACPRAFGAYAYGFASDDSYGYPAGLALGDIADEACLLSPDTDFNPPGTNHSVTAQLTDNVVDPLPGVFVDFQIAGTNAGVAGTCSPNADCTTDQNGLVTFTYPDSNGTGFDEISGSFLNSEEETIGCQPTPSVAKFWDDDCNENGIPDTCDISCGGFAGECNAYPLCGQDEAVTCQVDPIVYPHTSTPPPGDWGEGIVGWDVNDTTNVIVMAARALGLLAYQYDDLTSPAANPVSEFAPPGCTFEDLDVIDDRWIAAAAGHCGAYLLDYANPAAPVLRGQFDTTYAKDVSAFESGGDTYLFVGDYFDGLHILETDTSVPGTLAFTSQPVVAIAGNTVAVHYQGGQQDEAIWVAHTNGLSAVSHDTGAVIGSCTTNAGNDEIPQDVVTRGGVAYMTTWVNGMMSIDVSVPSQLSGSCASNAIQNDTDTCQAFYKLALNEAGNELYVTEGQYGVAVFGVDDGVMEERDYSQVLLDGQPVCTDEGPEDPVLANVRFAWGVYEHEGVVGATTGLLSGPTGGYQLFEPPPIAIDDDEDEVGVSELMQALLLITGGQRVSCGLIGIEPFLLLGAMKLVQRARRRTR